MTSYPNNPNQTIENEVYNSQLDYSRSFTMFDNNLSTRLKEVSHSILNADLSFKLLAMTLVDDLWKGQEFFVTQISLNEKCAVTFKLSSDAIGILLSKAIGYKKNKYETADIKQITSLEGRILTVYIEYLFKNFKELFISSKKSLKSISQGSDYKKMINFTFCIYSENDEEKMGSIVISFPEFIYKQIDYIEKNDDLLDIMQFEQSSTLANIYVGKSKITLEGIKNLEPDDYIILENSNLHVMTILVHEKIVFNVNPNPSIVVDIENEEESEMTDTEQRSIQNIWDSLQVDVSAEFEKIKMTLGELRQIADGLVVDIAPIVKNEITLSVENKKIASGELVIIGDRYGVKINKVYNDPKPEPEAEKEEIAEEESIEESEQINIDEIDDNDFDYSDFEIDDDL